MHDSVRDLVMRKLCLQPCLAVWELTCCVYIAPSCSAVLCSLCAMQFVSLMLTLRVWVMQVHTAIREDPAPQKERSKPSETKLWKAKKLTYDERKQKLKVPLLLSLLLSVLPSALPMLLLPTTSPQCRSAFLFSLDVSV